MSMSELSQRRHVWRYLSHQRSATNASRTSRATSAPDCYPTGSRIPISVSVSAWGEPLNCTVIRADHQTKEILVALPDQVGWTPHAERDDHALVGWPQHGQWHEASVNLTAPLMRGTKTFRIRVSGIPVHNERRRHVRAKISRPVYIYPGGDKIRAMTMDISEAALRVVMGIHENIRVGSKVHLQLSFAHRHRGNTHTMNFDGHVYRSRELRGPMAGKKEVVIFYEHMSSSERDYIRGLVFDWDLLHHKPQIQDN